MTKNPTFVRNPVKMKLFVLLLAVVAALPAAHCQLPPADSLHAALDTFLHRQLAAQLAEFDNSNRGAWMNYMPSVGIGYNLATDAEGKLKTKPRPTVSFSLSQVFAAQRRRMDINAKRRSLAAAAELAASAAHAELDRLLTRHELLTLELETMRQVSAIDAEIFRLAQLDYDDAKLAPNAFLPKQKAYLESKLALTRKEMEVRELEGEVLRFSRF